MSLPFRPSAHLVRLAGRASGLRNSRGTVLNSRAAYDRVRAREDTEAVERARQQKITDAVNEWLAEHQGCTFKTGYLPVQHEHPELFPLL